ncbi:MAG: flagella assembly protein FlgT middle domain-containing protein [Gallionella sp.]|nr:flagella assembly protein FlgT middle domain-containing protein [Gallionella sp.]
MLINVGLYLGNLFAASACKQGARRYFAAALCTSALFCMVQTASAELETGTTEPAKTTVAYTGRVRAEGAATIGVDGRRAARQTALNNALRNAAALADAQATAGKLPGAADVPQQNQDVLTFQQGSYYAIVREWQSQGIYHVAVSAEVVKGKFDAKNAVLVRVPIPKKKIVITQFDVAKTIHVDDINNIYDGFPAALSSRLEASGEFLSSSTGRSIPSDADTPQRDAIIQIAGETGAQFLISGMVVNAGTGHERWSVDTPFDWSLKVPFGGYKKRYIEVEFSVYDGRTGSRLSSHHLGDHAEGDVTVGNNKPFGSSLFFETEFGKATNRLLDSAVKDIHEALEKVPFSARIVQVEGRKVYLDAGSDALLEPGDKLVAYISDAQLKGAVAGTAERAADVVTLTQVKPQLSIGELPEDAAKLGIKAGNLARVNFADQRDLAAKQIAAQQLAKAQMEIKAEAERVKAEQAAQAEAARIKAEQAAQAEAARIKEEQRAQAQAAAEAKAAKLKAQKEANTARVSAAQKARTRALFVRIKAAQKAKAQAAAEAKAAKLKAQKEAKAEAARAKTEPEAATSAEAQPAAENNTQQTVKGESAGGKKNTRKVLPPGERAVQAIKKSKPKP